MSSANDALLSFDIKSPVEFHAPGFSRSGIELLEHDGSRWLEWAPGCVSPVAITLEEKAALTIETGNWSANDHAWVRLPRWQRADLWRQGKRSFGNSMGYRQARRYGREVLGYVP